MTRPIPVTLVSLYFGAFSCLLLAALLKPLLAGEMHSRWSDAAFPLAFALLATLIPAAIGLLSFVLWIVCMVKAYQGQRFMVPVAGDIATNLAGR